MDIRREIINCLENVGILIDPSLEDVNINDYDVDSITFISFIVDIEKVFNIEIPDGLLYKQVLQSLNGFVSLVEELIESNAQNSVND